MSDFKYKKDVLYCENINLEKLCEQIGTPFYVYSKKTLLDNYRKLKAAFRSVNPLICYSVKANSNLAVLNTLVKAGSGLDIVSGGELFRAKKIKCPADKIVYASVGKTEPEIADAIKYGIRMFNVESVPELIKINSCAVKMCKKVDIALRINPDVEPKTHKYITTGKKETKFGIDMDTAWEVFNDKDKFRSVNLCGIHLHIGSQILTPAPFVKAINKTSNFIGKLKKNNINITTLNIGGGLGIIYDNESPATAAEFAAKILPSLKKLDLKIILEPGRFIAGNAGAFVCSVTYVKDTPVKRFLIIDGAMNDLVRPSLYGAYHSILPLIRRKENDVFEKCERISDVVGPVCESGDFLGKERKIDVSAGGRLAV
ncbi:MAG: diaminopimelate decarboxylase, partial [Candidatus Omnitrophota bacterium]